MQNNWIKLHTSKNPCTQVNIQKEIDTHSYRERGKSLKIEVTHKKENTHKNKRSDKYNQ